MHPFLSYIQDKHLFWKGLNYMDCKEYQDACYAFEKSRAYKHLVIAYAKVGYFQKALALAQQKKYYRLGAKIALHCHDLDQAAYFYTYFDQARAGKIYRELGQYYKAGYAFLSCDDPLDAIDMFRQCPKPWQKDAGYAQVKEYALVLYFKKSYEMAFKLFIALDDYYAALECAKVLDEPQLIEDCTLLIGLSEAEKGEFLFAAQCIEPYEPWRATYFYALGGHYKDQIRLLLQQKKYQEALKVCLLHQNLNTAYQIASTYDPELLALL